MKKIIAVAVASFALVLGAMPALAGTPDPVHLTVQDLHCYQAGLVLGSADSPCTDPITCVPGDPTCAWVCSDEAFTVECSTAPADPGLLNWVNILYRTIDHYRAEATSQQEAADHLAAVVGHQSSIIQRKTARIAHLRKALARARHRH